MILPGFRALALPRNILLTVVCVACVGGAGVRPANADAVISAWLVVLHDATTHVAADAWATTHCAQPPLANHCTPTRNDGALATTVGVYEIANWPGLEGGPWVVAVGPVRSRRTAATVQAGLAQGGLTARLARLPALPRVQQWATDVAGRWRLWSLRGPATQQEMLYLSREGEADVELARGWPIPRATGSAELYPIAQDPDGASYYFYYEGAVRRLVPAEARAEREPPQHQAAPGVWNALTAHLGNAGAIQLQWVLPFAVAATVDLGSGDGLRRRFVMLRLRSGTWTVERAEVQVRAAPAQTVPTGS